MKGPLKTIRTEIRETSRSNTCLQMLQQQEFLRVLEQVGKMEFLVSVGREVCQGAHQGRRSM